MPVIDAGWLAIGLVCALQVAAAFTLLIARTRGVGVTITESPKRAYRTIPNDPDDPRPNSTEDRAAYLQWRARQIAKLDGTPAPKPRLKPLPKISPDGVCIGRIAYERQDHRFVVALNDEGKQRFRDGKILRDMPVVVARRES